MNAQQFYQSLTGICRPAPKPVHLPLTARQTRQLVPVNLGGNKLITGPAGSGVTFFTKYLIHTGYSKARILFLDASNNFGWYQDRFQPWFLSVNRFDWPGQDTPFNPSDSSQWLDQSVAELPEGLTVIDVSALRLYSKEADYAHFWPFLQNILLQFSTQSYKSDKPTILILDQLWKTLLFLTPSVAPLVDRFIHSLKTNRKYNREIWLLDDTSLYDSLDTRNKTHVSDCQKMVAHLDHFCLLEHRANPRYIDSIVPAIYGLVLNP